MWIFLRESSKVLFNTCRWSCVPLWICSFWLRCWLDMNKVRSLFKEFPIVFFGYNLVTKHLQQTNSENIVKHFTLAYIQWIKIFPTIFSVMNQVVLILSDKCRMTGKRLCSIQRFFPRYVFYTQWPDNAPYCCTCSCHFADKAYHCKTPSRIRTSSNRTKLRGNSEHHIKGNICYTVEPCELG